METGGCAGGHALAAQTLGGTAHHGPRRESLGASLSARVSRRESLGAWRRRLSASSRKPPCAAGPSRGACDSRALEPGLGLSSDGGGGSGRTHDCCGGHAPPPTHARLCLGRRRAFRLAGLGVARRASGAPGNFDCRWRGSATPTPRPGPVAVATRAVGSSRRHPTPWQPGVATATASSRRRPPRRPAALEERAAVAHITHSPLGSATLACRERGAGSIVESRHGPARFGTRGREADRPGRVSSPGVSSQCSWIRHSTRPPSRTIAGLDLIYTAKRLLRGYRAATRLGNMSSSSKCENM